MSESFQWNQKRADCPLSPELQDQTGVGRDSLVWRGLNRGILSSFTLQGDSRGKVKDSGIFVLSAKVKKTDKKQREKMSCFPLVFTYLVGQVKESKVPLVI